MNGKFTCHEEMCNEYNSCKVRKPIGLACVLSGLSMTTEGWGCGNNNKTIEIKTYTGCCDNKMCKKKKLIYKLIEKHNKLIALSITWCSDWGKCYSEYREYLAEKIGEKWHE